MIVLIGFMGAGKTTVGRILADRLGLPFIDTDEMIERRLGRSISQIFETEGEGAFRALERAAVARALAGPEAVVALGGGAVTDPTTCAALEWHTVVSLDVGYPEAMKRVGHDPGRPLLHVSDPRALYDERKVIYDRLASRSIDTGGRSPEEVATLILDGLEPPGARVETVRVELGARSYPVLVGRGISSEAGALAGLPDTSRAFLITHPVLATAAKPLVDSLDGRGIRTEVLFVDEGEGAKRLAVAEQLMDDMAGSGAHRGDLVVGFGGGVVCDLAGFVASTYHRGLSVLQVPTTLLAQVDAAIGGKTAVNLPRGKNLAGTIHQPVAVVCDVSLLASLPDEELRSGLAEVVKYGLISDPGLLTRVVSHASSLLGRDEDELVATVRRSVAIKASVVGADEREHGRREILNYGHTFGHAIEHTTGMRHGEAISAGMVAAAHLAIDLDMLDPARIDDHLRPLIALGLPTDAALDIPATLDALRRDKKHRDGVRFVLLEDLASVRTGVAATDDLIELALRKVAA